VTRQEAEEILSTKTWGTFLVRLSDRIWGYALSYRAEARCRHYLIDAGDGCYRFFGTSRPLHRSLHQLVDCHKVADTDATAASPVALGLPTSVRIPAALGNQWHPDC